MLGKKLKNLRKENHITQEELAKKIGISTSMVGMYETDARKPSYEVLLKISKCFNVSTDYLLMPDEELAKQINFIESLKLDTPEQALKFILQQPALMDFGGYDLDEMSEEEIMDLANDMLLAMKLSIERKKK